MEIRELSAVCAQRDADPEQQRAAIEALLKAGADVHETDKNGVTPLHHAVRFRNPAAVETLLAHGAAVNQTCKRSGSTALHRAVTSTGAPSTAGKEAQAREIVEILLRYGADPSIKNKNGKMAAEYVHDEELRQLLTARSGGEAKVMTSRSHSDLSNSGEQMLALAAELFPWHRSVTGAGLRQTLRRIAGEIPLEIHEVPSGSPALDFTIPAEWEIRDAYVADASGQRVIDYRASNLHVVAYSQPINRSMAWTELDPQLHSLPEKPDSIPYRTAYFREEWGFCLPHSKRVELAARGPAERYEVVIDAAHRPGSLSYGACFLPGATDEEILIHTHTCHPSLANDNLSGIVVAVALARWLAAQPQRRYGYRFVFAPATIGALAWLSRNRETVGRIRHGLVLAQLGDAAPLTYKRSQQHQATIDWAMIRTLRERGTPHRVIDFQPWGYDERQYCSPGFDLPVGRLTRSADGEYPEYHTSADNLSLLSAESLADSLDCLVRVLSALEGDPIYRNTSPYGEIQLGRRGLYAAFGQSGYGADTQRAIQWLLNQCNGRRGLLEIAERSGLDLKLLRRTADLLSQEGLLECASPHDEAE